MSQDRNRTHLHRIMSVVGNRPEFVKEASDALVGEDLSGLPNDSFADPANRLYPMHTKEATWVSACYMANDAVEGEPVKRLEKFARAWGIYGDVQAVFAKVETNRIRQKLASEKLSYALDEQYGDQQVQRFPVNNADMTKLSSDRFYSDRDKYPYAWRNKVAKTLLDRIDEFDLRSQVRDDVITYLEKAAGYGQVNKAGIWRALAERRLRAAKHPALNKLASLLEYTAEQDNPPLAYIPKLCSALSSFDNDANIREFVELPEEQIVGNTVSKVANDLSNFVKLTDGQWYDIRNATPEKLAAVDPSLADLPSDELPDVLETLPRDQVEMLRML